MMKKTCLYLTALILCVFSGYRPLPANTPGEIVHNPREIIIKLKPEIEIEKFQRDFSQQLQSTQLLKKSAVTLQAKPLFTKQFKSPPHLENIHQFTLPESIDLPSAIAWLQTQPGVIYAQPNYIHQLDNAPNDPQYPDQWGLRTLQIEAAWQITQGSPDVLVGVIDTGIEYAHEDLWANIWVNPGEDLNQNGLADDADFNGIDDDQNGYVDDVHGWDFTDAPFYPDNGDFQDRDNDPADEHGHGTAIAGIIAAAGNNNLGIIGAAPGCRLLNLRAGTSRGLLEEDDVASAIVYAVTMGAQVLNMSFGDKVASPLLRDVMHFAFQHNCVLIASSGNSASDSTHYPSGFREVISVGASNEDNFLAGYSNYGTTLDLVAPGVNILSTGLNNSYENFGGTSAAAPFVSGVAALMLSQNPALSNETLKGALIASAVDVGDFSWDPLYGAGILNAWNALNADNSTRVEIENPQMDQGILADEITVKGTAASALLHSYTLSYGIGTNPDLFYEIVEVTNRQVVNDSLGVWDISGLPDSSYTLRLTLLNKDDSQITDRIIIFIDHSPPEMSKPRFLEMLLAEQRSVLIEFETDDVCAARIFYRPIYSDQTFLSIDFDYISRIHRLNISQDQLTGEIEFYFQLQNQTGLITIEDQAGSFYHLNLASTQTPISDYARLEAVVPAGFLLGKSSDFDRDGKPEIIISEYQTGNTFGPVKIYEFDSARFQLVSTTPEVAIPKDWGDSDGDGKMEILANRGPVTTIWEAPQPGMFPNQLVWSNANDVWGSRFCDLNSDGKGEFVARVGHTFTLFENSGDNQFTVIDSFPNFTPGSNITGIPHSEIGDFDNDGKLEILLGDYDGDIYIYESQGISGFTPTWSQRLPLMDAIDFISAGDYNGDGVKDFAAGCHSAPDLDSEHEYDSRHWLWRIYQTTGDNSFEVVWEQRIFGFFPPKDFDSGVNSGDYDNDGRDELLLNIFPNVYLIDYDSARQNYYPAWYYSPGQSNSSVIFDGEGDGRNEFMFNDGSQLISFQNTTGSGWLAVPLDFKYEIPDTNQVTLSWLPVEKAVEYRIYRGTSQDDLQPVSTTGQNIYVDSTVAKNSHYYYAVTALDEKLPRQESPLSRILHVHLSDRPYLKSGQVLSAYQIKLVFSEPMNAAVEQRSNYILANGALEISSVNDFQARRSVILTTKEALPVDQAIQIRVIHVYDVDRMPIDTTRNRVTIQRTPEILPPYLVRANYTGQSNLALEFNTPMDEISAGIPANYQLSPEIGIDRTGLSESNPAIVNLALNPQDPIGAYGHHYIIEVKNLVSLAGVPIQTGRGDQTSITFYQNDLSKVGVYPNPFRADRDHAGINFINLTQNAKIIILNISGIAVKTLEENDGNGGINWDLKTETGETIPSGIYIYQITSGKERVVGKFAVMR